MLRDRGSKGEAEERTELNLAVALPGGLQCSPAVGVPPGCTRDRAASAD